MSMTENFTEDRRSLCEALHTLARSGLSPGATGNASVRVANGMLISPTGLACAEMKESELVFVSENGDVPDGQLRPSSEWHMHLAIYNGIADAGGIVRCHSRFATTLASLRKTNMASILSNPASLHVGSKRYRYNLNTATGTYFNDKSRLLDDFDDAEEEGERLNALSQQRLLFPSDFDRQIAIFERMDGKLFTLSGGSINAVALPIDGVDTTIITSVVSRLATAFDYQPEDATTLRTAPILGVVTPPDLKSRIIIHGIAVSDIGVNFSRDMQWLGGIRAGITLKYQGVRLLERAIEIDEYDEITLDEFKRGLSTEHNLNADIGIYKSWSRWHSSLAITSLNGKTYTGPSGSQYRQNPGVLAGLSYKSERAVAALDWDVVPSQRRFGLLDDEQRVRLSGQYRLNRRWHLGTDLRRPQ